LSTDWSGFLESAKIATKYGGFLLSPMLMHLMAINELPIHDPLVTIDRHWCHCYQWIALESPPDAPLLVTMERHWIFY
jgi:hypothetical protein